MCGRAQVVYAADGQLLYYTDATAVSLFCAHTLLAFLLALPLHLLVERPARVLARALLAPT